ncbi:hypothetical protein LAG90_07225 [Marinilongibacter aquaticus]|uniref:hypothetical protein n=1 Tax=Marinilongibacter aquaticus TaxID=2975157 RepID=UPI0021BD22C7|nr:hypothetical protein [Marinilongibacter aquaticus]UBM60434.1 hypothetical protein LAG90_07225 [Marinilongibacter aquaticus]
MKATKQIGAIVLLAILGLKAMIVPTLFINYQLRKDFIIKNYCVNKEFPELHCDGKCYLAKQIKAAQQEDERQAETQFFNKLLGFECLSGTVHFAFEERGHLLEERAQKVFYRNPFFLQNYSSSVFHPPQSVLS